MWQERLNRRHAWMMGEYNGELESSGFKLGEQHQRARDAVYCLIQFVYFTTQWQ